MDLLEAVAVGRNDDLRDEVIKEFYQNRTLIINDEISDWILEDIILNILLFNKDDKNIPPENRTPILLIIDSEGGSVFTSNNLVDVIKASKTPVYGVGFSMVASAAFSIFIACHKRYSFEHTIFLMHESSRQLGNSAGKMRDWMDFLDELDDVDKRLTLERTKVTDADYEQRKRDEVLFFAKEAKEKGIVDSIIGIDCDLDEIL